MSKQHSKENINASPARLVLVDGYGFVFRAYHSLPPLTSPNDTPVGAVYGFTNMLLKLRDTMHAEYMAVILDAGRKSFRNDLYAEYKANRPPAPEDLVPQFPLIREAVDAMNIPVVEMEGYEADDLIATYARQAQAQGMEVVIVSSDKDLMQLVGNGITMYDPMKTKVIDVEQVQEKFGVSPEKVLDVLALMGDSSDNIPGVPSIGPKTAAQLISEYGDLESILSHVDDIKQKKRKEVLKENADQARLSKDLARLCEDAPVTIGIDAFEVQKMNVPHLVNFLHIYGFKAILARIEKAYGKQDIPETAAEQTPSASKKKQYILIEDKQSLDAWLADARLNGRLAIHFFTDKNTVLADAIMGVGLAKGEGEACYIPLSQSKQMVQDSLFDDFPRESEQSAGALTLDTFNDILTDNAVLKIGYNIKQDIRNIAPQEKDISPVEDIMLQSYVLQAGLHNHSLEQLISQHLEVDPEFEDIRKSLGKSKMPLCDITSDEAKAYNCKLTDYIFQLHILLKKELFREHMLTVYERIERPLIPVLAEMECTGIKVDVATLKSLSNDFEKRSVELQEEIHALAGHSFNIGSPKQLGEILFDEMGLKAGKKTKTGAYVTNAEVLEELAAQGHTLPEKVLQWRQLSKLKSTYTDALQHQIDPKTGRVHTHFEMAVASTGRLSSRDPNLQNIPIRTEEGNKIRRAFVAEKGNKLLSADYSQIELRLLAHMAKIDTLQEAFKQGLDIHAATASQMFNVPLEEMDALTRRKAKAINFGIIYGISAFGLARQLGISRGDAAQYIHAYFEKYPGIKEYIERCHVYAREHGYVETLFGRKCYIKDINAKNPSLRSFSERVSVNAPLQGTGADIIKKAMIYLSEKLKQKNFKARIVLQVHDELLLEVPENEVEQVASLVKKTMEGIVQLKVPLLVDVGVGDNWQEIH